MIARIFNKKLIGAHKNNKKLIFIPYDNKNDIDDIPAELKKDKEFKIKLVKHYSEVLPFLFEESIN